MSEIATVSIDAVPNPLPEELSVLDVREDVEWEHGHIDGAVHIPMNEVPERLDEIGGGQTLVVCKVGGRSGQVVAWLAEQGYDVVNLDGGMLDWAAAGRPMVSDNGQPARVV